MNWKCNNCNNLSIRNSERELFLSVAAVVSWLFISTASNLFISGINYCHLCYPLKNDEVCSEGFAQQLLFLLRENFRSHLLRAHAPVIYPCSLLYRHALTLSHATLWVVGGWSPHPWVFKNYLRPNIGSSLAHILYILQVFFLPGLLSYYYFTEDTGGQKHAPQLSFIACFS